MRCQSVRIAEVLQYPMRVFSYGSATVPLTVLLRAEASHRMLA